MFVGKDVSVVIPSYNSQDTVAACLDSLLGQTVAPGEIILVDSSDHLQTAQLVTERFPQVRLKKVKKRIFPGPARNLGADLASGEIIAFVDADCIAEPHWIERLVDRHNQGHLVVGGAVMLGNRRSAIAWAGHLGEFREFLPVGEPRSMLHIPTCNISYRKVIFSGRGGFPDAYYPQEDLLFNYMLNRQGIKILFDPAIQVRHFAREGLHDYLSHQHRIGRVTRSTLRRIDMQGSRIARLGWLAWLASPALGVVKFLRTTIIFGLHYPKDALRRPILLILLALGATWWARGFAAGARRGLSGIQGWDDPEEPIFALMTVGGTQVSSSPERK